MIDNTKFSLSDTDTRHLAVFRSRNFLDYLAHFSIEVFYIFSLSEFYSHSMKRFAQKATEP